jgi:hypothetical protein
MTSCYFWTGSLLSQNKEAAAQNLRPDDDGWFVERNVGGAVNPFLPLYNRGGIQPNYAFLARMLLKTRSKIFWTRLSRRPSGGLCLCTQPNLLCYRGRV